uniref:Apple domain-containing protein n=1 Tax=Panagrellus redivivus TaxID=6233 RepID=A0A7E4VCC4_PANRE
MYSSSRPSTSNCQTQCAIGSSESKSASIAVKSNSIPSGSIKIAHYMRLTSPQMNDQPLHNSVKSKKSSDPLRRMCCIPLVLHMSTLFTFQLRLLILSMFCGFGLVAGQPIGGSRCFYFGPGMTIHGGDYRRDFDVTQGMCAQACREDGCCMAFEFADGECTLKSRSLNGTIAPKAEAFFGLCLDYEDDDRERFWDHELGGIEVAVQPELERDACDVFCHDIPGSVIYSWRTSDARNVDAEVGECRCISVLQSVKLSFGSFAGFLR